MVIIMKESALHFACWISVTKTLSLSATKETRKSLLLQGTKQKMKSHRPQLWSPKALGVEACPLFLFRS